MVYWRGRRLMKLKIRLASRIRFQPHEHPKAEMGVLQYGHFNIDSLLGRSIFLVDAFPMFAALHCRNTRKFLKGLSRYWEK
ncbi:hypothetical protein D3C87_1625760 [compost metagenome]